MSKLPTDLEILEVIYKDYSAAFQDFKLEAPSRASKIYVPIDVEQIAARLHTDAHELFGRLYYHLDHVYRYKQEDGALVQLFAFAVSTDRHCINYPYLAAILAERRSHYRREFLAIGVSLLSLAVALGALAAQLAGRAA